MPYCHKCGSEVKKENSFCPQCGVTLTGMPQPPMPPVPQVHEKEEKFEKQEKNEKNEKHEKMEKNEQQEKYEKQEFGILGPLIGGVILIVVGLMFYLAISGTINLSSLFPVFLIIIGVIVLVAVGLGAVMARGKNPRP